MHVWINGAYQGWLKPHETRYTVPDGFEDSHAGWRNTDGKVTITYQFPGGEKTTMEYSGNESEVYFAGTDSSENGKPDLPSEAERENAGKIIKGHRPNLDMEKEDEADPDPENRPKKEGEDTAPATLKGFWKIVKSRPLTASEERGAWELLRFGDNSVYGVVYNSMYYYTKYRGSFQITGDRITIELKERMSQFKDDAWESWKQNPIKGRILPDGIVEIDGFRYKRVGN